MDHIHAVATRIPGVGKTMLTCFVSNERGTQFYKKLGFEVDESSPRDRKLRGGKVVKADYMILARAASIRGVLDDNGQEQGQEDKEAEKNTKG
jgi:RimJ/RimL family protein N-acetyltransferase